MITRKLRQEIDDFLISVGRYLAWEYPSVYDEFRQNTGRFYDFIGGYYIEDRTVPFVAHYVMALIVQDKLMERNSVE